MNKENKMNFIQFLNEKYKEELTEEEVKKIINEKCKNFDPETPIWRGMSNSGDFVKVTGKDGFRQSANTSNHYTVLIDHFTKEGHPLRSKSIICSTERAYAKNFGSEVYAIIPYDNTIIGVVNNPDIWGVKVEFNSGYREEIDELNNLYTKKGIKDTSYEIIKNGIIKLIEKGDEEIIEIFGDDTSVIDRELKDAYSPEFLNFEYMTTKEYAKYYEESELWIGGPCIAVKREIYKKLFH